MLNRYINIGIWVTVLFGAGLITFTVIQKNSQSKEYIILFNESMGGLYTGSEVFLNGMNIGLVSKLQVSPENIEQSVVVVKTKILKQIPNIRAEIGMRGFTGHSCINMYYVKDSALLEPIDGINQIKSTQSLIGKVRSKLESLANDDTFLNIIRSISESVDSVKYTFVELRNVLSKLDSFINTLNSVVSLTPDTIIKINEAVDSITTFTNNLNSLINDSHLSVLLNKDLKNFTYSQSDLRNIVRDLRQIISSIKRRPLQFLSNGVQTIEA